MAPTSEASSQAVVHEFYACIGRGDFGSALELMDETAVLEFFGPSAIPLSGRYGGRDEIKGFFERIGDALTIEKFEVQDFIVDGDKVAVTGRERSTVRNTGRTFDVPWVQIFDVAGGRITLLRDYFETASLLQAFTDNKK